MSITLFPMQQVAVQKAIEYFESKDDKPVIMVAPTAYGKSIVISEIARLIGKVLVIQPSKELLEQNYQKLIALGGNASIYSASMGTKEIGDITYATIGSIKNIAPLFKQAGVKAVLVDEVHLMPVNAGAMFGGFVRDLGIKKVIGLTATPFRLGNYTSLSGENYSQLNMLTSRKKGCGYFKKIIYCCQIHEIISAGRWSPLKYEFQDFVSTALRVNSTGAEFTEKSVKDAYEQNDLNGRIDRYIKESDRKHILIFVPTVEAAYALSERIWGSAVVHGELPKSERDWVINNFRSGKTRVVINVNVLSVGFDYPEIDCIILARPTMSLAWLYQAIGRGTRIHPNKVDCLIVDFVGVIQRFGKIENLVIEARYGSDEVWSGNRKLSSVNLSELGVAELKDAVLSDGKVMPFGKHKGTHICRLQTQYMSWMLENFSAWSSYPELKKDFMEELSSRQAVLS